MGALPLTRKDEAPMALTDIKCRTTKPAEKTYKLSDAGGLYLTVNPNGSKLWHFKYRYDRREKKLSIGPYPLVSLAEARDFRDDAKRKLRAGLDPSAEKAAAKKQRLEKAENTFDKQAWEWYEHNLTGWSKNHANTVSTRLKQDILPQIGRMPITDVKALDLLAMVRKIEAREAYEVARRSLQYCGQIFRFAILHGRAEINPTPNLKGALKSVPKGHYAAFDSRELPAFLEKFHRNDARLFPITRLALELMMLTFVRTSELIKAEWSEFDFNEAIWRIPAARMKMKRDHLVPLSSQAISILTQLRTLHSNQKWIFPSQIKPRNHMSNNTILTALARMGYRGIMTGHGFRALAMSTIKEKLGYRHEVIDRQLAHAQRNQVVAAYDRAEFLDDRTKMMQDWADYIDKIRN